MEHRELIEAAEREGAALVAALLSAPAGARVPSCPDWAVEDLGHHVGGFLGHWLDALREAAGEEPVELVHPDDDELALWVAGLLADLVARLSGLDADATVRTWVPSDQTAGFVARRAACELAIHRVDAQLAVGAHEPIAPALAVEVIDEVFVMLANFGASMRERRGLEPGSGETLHLHATDEADALAGTTGGEWTIRLGADGVEVVRLHEKADCAIKATASDLALTLYGRPTIGDPAQFGDAAVLEAWYRAFRF